jgi:preprotein translocase subunit SecE
VSVEPHGDDPEGSGPEEVGQATGLAPQPHRPGGLARVSGFARGSWRELQKVHWPDRRQVMQATGVVIGFVIVAGAFLGIADLASSHLVKLILK